MRGKTALLLMLGILMIFATCSCSKNASDALGIRGEIKEIFLDGENIAVILVEGKVESDTVYDKAKVAIREDTVILKTNGEELKPQDLGIGMKVEVVFQGQVAESYPVQGKAKAIRVLD